MRRRHYRRSPGRRRAEPGLDARHGLPAPGVFHPHLPPVADRRAAVAASSAGRRRHERRHRRKSTRPRRPMPARRRPRRSKSASLRGRKGDVSHVQVGLHVAFTGRRTRSNLRKLEKQLHDAFGFAGTPFEQIVIRVAPNAALRRVDEGDRRLHATKNAATGRRCGRSASSKCPKRPRASRRRQMRSNHASPLSTLGLRQSLPTDAISPLFRMIAFLIVLALIYSWASKPQSWRWLEDRGADERRRPRL